MNRIHFLIVFLLLSALCTPSTAIACRAAKRPTWHPIQDYSQIFIAEVVGVHLTEREEQLVKSVSEGHPDEVRVSSSTDSHEVAAVIIETLKGSAPSKLKMTIGGCGVEIPRLGVRGIFFVTKTGDVIPVYESNTKQFEYWVEHAKTELTAKR